MVTTIEKIKEFGGYWHLYEHTSQVCACPMRFSIFLPPQVAQGQVPALYWLSGLTCTEANFREKAGAARYAAELGIALVVPDTSPRGVNVPDTESYDLGQGAGFYLNATQAPWDTHFRMYDYIIEELPAILATLDLPLNERRSISGHSMGGHGALSIALQNPTTFCAVSAFAPICHPTQSPWGRQALQAYLGADETQWQTYDTCCLITQGAPVLPLRIDQGTTDEFYPTELMTEALITCCAQRDYPLQMHFQTGYDHGYHFVASFIYEHLHWHHQYLQSAASK